MIVPSKQVCIILVYISSLATAAYSVISTPNGLLLGGAGWLDILCSVFSLPILLLLPGLVIQDMIFRTSNPLDELGSCATILLSFFLSTFVNVTGAFVGYSVGHYVGGVFDFRYAAVTVYIVNTAVFAAYIMYVLLQSKGSSHRKSVVHIDKYALALLLLTLVILASESLIVFGNYPLIWGDQWRWLGNSRQVLMNQVDGSTFTTMYFYIFYLALCFAFTNLPLIHTYVFIGLATSVLLIASIYVLGRSIFGTRENATIYVWTCFLSVPFILPWLAGSTTRGVFNALQMVWNLESDVITIPNIFVPQFQFGLPAAFFLIAVLLCRKPKNLSLYLMCAVIAYVGYAAHIIEIFLFEIFLVLYLFIFSSDQTGDSLFLLSSSGGIALFLFIDSLSPFRWYSVYELGIFSLTAAFTPILVFILLKVVPKKYNYPKAIQAFLSSTRFVKIIIVLISSTVAGALLILFWLHSIAPHVTVYQFLESDAAIPWFIWAARVLVTLPIGILVYLLLARLVFNRLNIFGTGTSFGSFILFFITTIAAFRVSKWLVSINWYFEWRLEVFLMVAMAIPVAVLLITIRQHAKELPSGIRILGVVLLCLFLANGVIGIGSYVSFWRSYGIQFPRSYLVGASEAQVVSLNHGNVLTFSDYPSRQLLFLAGASKMKNNVPSEAFFSVKSASSFIALASSYNVSTIFLTQQDRNAICSTYPDNFLFKVLPVLPLTYSNEETIVLQLPSFVAPSSLSQIHLVEGVSFCNESLVELWFMVLASSGFQYDVVDKLPSTGVAVLANDVNGNLTELLSYVFNGGRVVVFIQGQTGALSSWGNISYTDDMLAVDSLEIGNTTFTIGLINARDLTLGFNNSDIIASYKLSEEKILPALIRINYGNGYVIFVNSEPFASSLIGSTSQPKEYALHLEQFSIFINKVLEDLVSSRISHKPFLEPFSSLFIGPVSLTGKSNFNLFASADAIMFDRYAIALLSTESKNPVLVRNASLIIAPRDSDLRVSLESKEYEISNCVSKRVVDISMHGQSKLVITSTTPFDVHVINQYTGSKEPIQSYRAVVWTNSYVKVNARPFNVTIDGCAKFEQIYYVDDLQRLRGLPWIAQSNFQPSYVMGSFKMQLAFLDSNVGAIDLTGSFSVNVVQQPYLVLEKGRRLNISELAITEYVFQNLIWLAIPVILTAAIASWTLVKTRNMRPEPL